MSTKKQLSIRIVSFLLTMLMVITVAPVTVINAEASGTADAQLIMDTVFAMPGETVEMNITLKNAPTVKSMSISNITFDTDKMTLTNVEWVCDAEIKNWNQSQGRGVLAFSENTDANGTVVKLTFEINKIVDDADVNVMCSMSLKRMDDADNEIPVSVSIISGSVTIRNAIRGDIDANDKLNSNDAVYLLYYVMFGKDDYPIRQNGDMDGNGKVNSNDAVYLLYHVMFGKEDYPLYVPCAHALQHVAAKAMTCTVDGNIEYWNCTKCGKCFSDDAAENEVSHESTILKAAHNKIVKEAVPATSTSEGYTEGIWCDRCNTWLSGHERIEPIPPNTRAISYNFTDPYLLQTLNIDEIELVRSYVPGERLVLDTSYIAKYLRNLGYNFVGWYDGPDAGATQIKEIPASADEDKVLYAHVTEIEYNITYNLYQTPIDSAPTEKQQKYTVSKGNSNLYDPRLKNYIFLGWFDENGTEYKTIPIGTTGDITLKPYYTSERNLAVSKVDNNPIILEDQNTNVVYFTYEIGEIRNIPLNADKPFWEIQSVAGLSQQVSETYTTSITNSEAENVSKTISDMTSNSSTWTLSENWNDVTTVNETWAKSIQKDTEVCKTEATTSSGTLSISAQNGGSTYHKTEDGSTVYDYDTKTVTKDKGHQFDASLSGNYTNKTEVNLGASSEYGATDSYGYTSKSKDNEYNHSASGSDKDAVSSGIKYENGFEVNAGLKYGYHNNTNTVTKTGTDKVTVNSEIDENTSSWNYAGAFSSTQQHSTSQTVRNALSDIVTTTKGYGNSYSKGGSDTKTQGFSSTASNTTGTSSSVTYSKLESKTTTSTYSVDGKIEGKYRSILVGKAHVFAVVGYDYATKSYFTYTFSVMDDKVEEFLDYTPKGGSFDDCEYSCLPFEIPYDVFEYVSGRTSKTTGVQYITDSLNGTAKVTGYVGESTDVIIPSYVSDGKQAYKVTEISGKAFAGKSVRSVSLGEFITEIPDAAFKNCTMLEEVVGSFTSIGNEAFSGCVNLTNMNIPSNVVKIGTDAFVGANSISVRAVNSLASYTEAVQQLPDASDDEIRAKQKEITQEFIKAILDSGAQNIVLDISYIAEGTPLSLIVPKIESIEINGGTKTYNDFRIDSSAENTTLNELTVVDSRGTPIKVDSGKLTLRKVFVNSNTTAVILKRDGAILSLSQDSAVKTNSSYAIIGKNLVIESQVTADGASGYLGVTGNLGYVNSVSGEDYISISNGDLIQISEEEFERYIKGQSTVSFDANEGILDTSEASCSVFYGEKIGTLPVPARDYHNFLGWFTEKDGGTRITEDDVVTRTDDITLYAHWELKPLSGWVRADSVPADGAAVNRYWSFTVSSTSGVDAVKRSEWQLVSSSSQWSDYGAWSSWSRNSISSSDSRQVQTKTVTDREAYTNYRYWIYRSSDGYSFGTKNYKSDSGRICTKYDEINLTYPLESLGYSGLYGYYDSSMFSHSYDNKWFFGESTDVPAETHTEYSYRDRSLVYTYSFESTYDPTVYENVSNAVEWVQYRVK